MPEIVATTNPSTDPTTYPGDLVTSNCLLTPTWRYDLTETTGRHVSDWQVQLDGEPLASDTQSAKLDAALAHIGAAPMEQRSPYLAIGSNASPGQLRHKFGTDGWLVPITRASMRGIGVGYSAHVSRAGYIPYAPYLDPTNYVRTYVVLWLDDAQAKRLDETEPNYDRLTLHDRPLVLDSGVRIDSYALYRSRHGVLRAPDGGYLAASTQTAALGWLARHPEFAALLPELGTDAGLAAQALGKYESLRIRMRELMREVNMTGPDELEAGTESGQSSRRV